MKKTKIICTIGPSSQGKKELNGMVAAGMDAARINTAHGKISDFSSKIKAIRKISDMPIILDIKGPEVRLNIDCPMDFKKNDVLTVGFDEGHDIWFNQDILSQIKKGDELRIADGMISAQVVSKSGKTVNLKCRDKICSINGSKGVVFIGKRMDVPLLSDKDILAIGLAKDNDVDFIALSFTRDKRDLLNLKRRLKSDDMGIIAKIENSDGVNNLAEIIKNSDGLMIARGDLGVELPAEKIPIIQKRAIEDANNQGKISIVATEMLHSMIDNPRPTRAETSDVANAILDGADAIMLSAESAIGSYPVAAVRTMRDIALEVESYVPRGQVFFQGKDTSLAIASAVNSIIDSIKIDKIVVLTNTGYTARLISNFKSGKDIIAFTPSRSVRRRLDLIYGVKPIYHKRFPENKRLEHITRYCLDNRLLNLSDNVLFTAGVYLKKPSTNLLEIHSVKEIVEYAKQRDV